MHKKLNAHIRLKVLYQLFTVEVDFGL